MVFSTQYEIPASLSSEILPILAEVAFVATPLRTPVVLDEITWQSYRCRKGKAVALLAIGDVADKEKYFIASVSLDIRRVLLFWNLLRDMRLVGKVTRLLKKHGATILKEDTCQMQSYSQP